MISFITGLPGAGKGVYSVLKIIDELRATDRPILTNFAIRLYPWVRKLGRRRSRGELGLLGYLQDKYGSTFDAERRIKVLSDEQMQEFYLWRVDAKYELIQVGAIKEGDKNVGIEETAFLSTQPCLILADEGWKFWNARSWSKTEKGFLFYNAQHRKAGDDLLITAQHSSQIDKQMRVLVQEYHTLVNHRFRRIGPFKQPNVISVVISNEPPEMRNKTVGALPKMIKFDRQGIGGCFDTASGAGVQGMAADIEKKAKGMPFWGLFVMLIALGAGFILVARAAGYGAGKLLTVGDKKTSDAIKKTVPELARQSALGRAMLPGGREAVSNTERAPTATGVRSNAHVVAISLIPARRSPAGYAYGPKGWRVSLDDGRSFDTREEDCPVRLITRNFVVIGNETNFFR